MEGNEVICINCNKTGRYIWDYIRCYGCGESLYIITEKRKECINTNCNSKVFYITDKWVSADNYGGEMEIDAVLCNSCGMDQDIGDYV